MCVCLKFVKGEERPGENFEFESDYTWRPASTGYEYNGGFTTVKHGSAQRPLASGPSSYLISKSPFRDRAGMLTEVYKSWMKSSRVDRL